MKKYYRGGSAYGNDIIFGFLDTTEYASMILVKILKGRPELFTTGVVCKVMEHFLVEITEEEALLEII